MNLSFKLIFIFKNKNCHIRDLKTALTILGENKRRRSIDLPTEPIRPVCQTEAI